MRLLGKSKVVRKQAKPEFTYPIVRLPQSEINLAGETAYVFKTEHNGKPVYIISLEEELNCELKVVQPETRSNIELRLEALEKEVYKTSKSKKEKWARCDSNAGPPPCEGDVITV